MGLYVVQVLGGREQFVASMIEHLMDGIAEECFLPLYELKKRHDGKWCRVSELLFPGYVFVYTQQPEKMSRGLWTIPSFTRLLGGNSEQFIPLASNETAWLEALTTAKAHMIQMSRGVIEGGSAIVTDGPLKGREAMITKIDRHKRLAYLDMRMFGRMKSIRVGLEIIRKQA